MANVVNLVAILVIIAALAAPAIGVTWLFMEFAVRRPLMRRLDRWYAKQLEDAEIDDSEGPAGGSGAP